MLRCTAVVFAICPLAFSAAADSSISALAAPGDCAQPSADYETPPLYEQAGVAGPAADHFVPNGATRLIGLLPIDLTRAVTTLGGVASGSADLVEGTAEGVSGTVDDAVGAVGEAANGTLAGVTGAVGDTGSALGAGGLGGATGSAVDALGSGGLAGGALGSATGAVDALTDTTTQTTSGVLGGLK